MAPEPARVLIVDDEPSIVLSLQFLMQSKGYQVAVARNGEEALKLAAEFKPQLVLLDVMMPAINGFEVCRRLRADPQHYGIKILILTARGRASEMQRGREEGADACLTKPFATQELAAAVAQLLTATA